jgi:hypothetical protein
MFKLCWPGKKENPTEKKEKKREAYFYAMSHSASLEMTSFIPAATAEDKHDNRPASTPQPAAKLSKNITSQVAVFSVSMFLGFLALFGLFWGAYRLGVKYFPSNSLAVDKDCTAQNTQAFERSFYINIRVGDNLSFAQAKLLDLAWDSIVGQGGRFVHGWILYHVAARTITWMMEISAIPIYFHLDMLFSTTSLMCLWSTSRLLFSKQPRRTALAAVWLLLGILYTLLFATIWGGATGYLSPGTPSYRMPDQSYATRDSNELRYCWVVEPGRVGGLKSNLIIGPSISQAPIYLDIQKNRNDIRDAFFNASISTEEARNFFACK